MVLALGFVAAVIASDRVFQGWRIDLTENRLYTLTEGTERILDNLEEPLHLYFYFSDRATRNIPTLRDYAGRIQEVLEEFEDAARGNLILDIIDPLPFSEDEVFKVIDVFSNDFEGKRNLLIVDTLYSTGIRRDELINIKLNDVFLSKDA